MTKEKRIKQVAETALNAAIASITIAMIMTVHNTVVRFICFILSLFFL